MEIRNVAVVGGGTMGAGIIYTISNFGIPVIFKEMNEDLVKRCQDQVTRMYASAVKKGKMTEEDMKKALRLIDGVTDYEGFEKVLQFLQVRSLSKTYTRNVNRVNDQ